MDPLKRLISSFSKPKTKTLNLKNLEDYLNFIEEIEIGKKPQQIYCILNQPVNLTHKGFEDYRVYIDSKIENNDYLNDQINKVIDIFYEDRNSFYANLQCQENPKIQTQMFSNPLTLNNKFLSNQESIIIQQPLIVLESQNGFGFASIYDDSNITEYNLKNYLNK